MATKIEKFVVVSDTLRNAAGISETDPVEQLAAMVQTAEAMAFGSTIMFDSVEKALEHPPSGILGKDEDAVWRTLKVTFEEVVN